MVSGCADGGLLVSLFCLDRFRIFAFLGEVGADGGSGVERRMASRLRHRRHTSSRPAWESSTWYRSPHVQSIVKLAMASNVHWAPSPQPACPRQPAFRVTADHLLPWRPAAPNDPPPLGSRAVHVWRVRLDPPSVPGAAWDLLSAEERHRARRFFQDHHRRRFVVAHSALRRILAGYTARPAHELEFRSGPQGKPALADSASGASPGLEFNLSHSADLALVAVAWERPVGVDLEQWEHDMDHLAIAERFFSPKERDSLRALADRGDDLVHGFFAAWSRKEAYLKARGEGVTRGLHHFDVTLAPGEPARLLADRLDAAIDQWRIRSIVPEQGFSAAIVAADPFEELMLLDEA
jgi:4'-phosphopantetheinyl transferase